MASRSRKRTEVSWRAVRVSERVLEFDRTSNVQPRTRMLTHAARQIPCGSPSSLPGSSPDAAASRFWFVAVRNAFGYTPGTA